MDASKPDRPSNPVTGARRSTPTVPSLLKLSALALVAVTVAMLLALPDHDRAAAKSRRRMPLKPLYALVTVPKSLRSTSVPPSFLGISTEYWSLPTYEQDMPALERVLSLLRVRGDGPFMLRIGGDSADHTFWAPHSRGLAPWAYSLAPAFVRHLRTLVRRADVRLILDMNLITGSPAAAARWASAAERGLPAGSIRGLEIGNEPDIYNRRDWLVALAEAPLRAGFLRRELSIANYMRDFAAYGQALARVAQSVPLDGPALANPVRHLDWLSSLLAYPHPGLGTITVHRYLFSRCARRHGPAYPTFARLLSERATAGMARDLRPAIRIAHAAGLALRLTELNSVTCHGVPGISDAFVTALWAPDALFELLRARVDGVNVHVRTNTVNAAFTLSREGLGPRPLLYGLIMFARTLAPHPRLVASRVREGARAHLKAWAVTVSPRTLHVLLIDKGSRPVDVRLRVPGRGDATIERLLAPSLRSLSGETLGGRWLGRDGRWHGRQVLETALQGPRGYEVTMPPWSAALVNMRLRPTPAAAHPGRRHRQH